MLPSGPALPPVSQADPDKVALDRCPGKTTPLSGTEYKKVSPKSKLACMPTANQSVPVRRNVKDQKSPVSTIPAMPTPFSPGLLRWTAPNAQERTRAAGQNPAACNSVNWG